MGAHLADSTAKDTGSHYPDPSEASQDCAQIDGSGLRKVWERTWSRSQKEADLAPPSLAFVWQNLSSNYEQNSHTFNIFGRVNGEERMSWKISWVTKWDYAVKTNTSRWTRYSCSRRTAMKMRGRILRNLWNFVACKWLDPCPAGQSTVMSACRDAKFTTRPDTGHQIVKWSQPWLPNLCRQKFRRGPT